MLGALLGILLVGKLIHLHSAPSAEVLQSLDSLVAPERHPIEPKAMHAVAEWSGHTAFKEAPMWRDRVEAGSLPPVAERVGPEPLVMIPHEQAGPYGGTWRRVAAGVAELSMFERRIGYDGLVRWDPMGRKILPNLAKRWEILEEGRVYIFYLRRGVRWSDGHPFTADDILFFFNDLLVDTDLHPAISHVFRRGGEMVRVDKLDDFTIRFRFKEPHGLFLKKMGSGLGYTVVGADNGGAAHYLKQFHRKYVPQERLEEMARAEGYEYWHQLFRAKLDWRNLEAPRLWPWIPKQVPPRLTIIFERNPYYWKVDPEGRQLPYIDRVAYEILNTEAIALKAINGDLGMQDFHLPIQKYSVLMENQRRGGYRVLHWIDGGDGMVLAALNLNHKDPVLRKIFHDRRFRIALSHAVDRREISEVSFSGLAEPRQLAPPPWSAFAWPALEHAHIRYDPALSESMLDEIGLYRGPDGVRRRPDGKPLQIFLEASPTTVDRHIPITVARHWTQVGVKTEAKLLASSLLTARMLARMLDAAIWTGGADVDPVMDPRFFLPFASGSRHAPAYSEWYESGGKHGHEPPPDMRRLMDLYSEIKLVYRQEDQIRLFQEIMKLNREHLWVIGLVGRIPHLVVVNDAFRNVPEVAVWSWPMRSPGNTAPECYVMDPAR